MAKFISLILSVLFVSAVSEKIAKQPKVTYDNGVAKVQDLSKYLQPDDLLSGKYDHADATKYRCARDCGLYPESRICYHKLVMEQYHVLGPACDQFPENRNACYQTHCVCADGFEKTILTINRQLCSPAIMVCQDDVLVLDVINKMPARTTTIHCHGVHFRGCPWLDGASHVTQCPIIEGQTFRYEIVMSQIGDFLYHSHDAIQMLDGLQGPLISRSGMPDQHADKYDEDLFSHTIFVQDWLHFPGDDKIPGHNRLLEENGFDNGKYYLINGRGTYKKKDGSETDTPFTVFKIVPGRRYRFRIVSSVSMPAILSVEDHDFLLITMDLDPIRAVRGSSLMIATGERYGIVLSANNEPRSYWIQVISIYDDAVQYAILQYVNEDGSAINESLIPDTKRPLKYGTPILNDVTHECDPTNENAICIDQFEALSPTPTVLLEDEPDYRLFITPSFHEFTLKELYVEGKYYSNYLPKNKGPLLGGGIFSDTYNNVSMSLPPFSILTQDNPFPPSLICAEECFRPDIFCDCTSIYKIPLGAVVEIVIIDETYTGVYYHAHHLHGNSFRVIKQGGPQEMDSNQHFYKNIIPNDYRLFPLRDTIIVPHEGYTIVRFWATNPGVWMFHCHISTHVFAGMSTILQIGERDQFPKPPKNFPKCGNYIPDISIP